MGYVLSQEAESALTNLFVRTAQRYGKNPGDRMAGQSFNASPKLGREIIRRTFFNRSAASLYAATPSVEQTLEKKIVELANPFLASLPSVPVSQLKGEKVLLSLSGRVARRTDTSGAGERTPNRLAATSSKGYELFKTEFDVALSYADIDAWAKFPNFADLYMQAVREAIAIDILVAGWYGTSAAVATNIVTNPDLADLNIGWLELIRTYNSGSQYAIGTVGVPISIGTGGTYANLDEAVHDIKQMIPRPFRKRGDLVALISDDLMVSQEDTYYQINGNTPSEKALLNGQITRAFGGLPSVTPPFFPDGSILITPLRNLAWYYQDSAVRRLQRDWPSKDEVQEFNSLNMGYVVQEELATAFVENITLV